MGLLPGVGSASRKVAVVPETGGSGRNYSLPSSRPLRAATLGTNYADDPAAVDVGETRQPTLTLDPGANCFVVGGGAPCRLSSELSSFRSAVAAHGLRR